LGENWVSAFAQGAVRLGGFGGTWGVQTGVGCQRIKARGKGKKSPENTATGVN